MKKIHKIFSYLLIYLFLFLTTLHALEKKKITNKDELREKLLTLTWYNILMAKITVLKFQRQTQKFKFMIMSII